MRKLNLLLGRGCRSDAPLTDPLIKRLEKEEWCNFQIMQLVPADFQKSFEMANYTFKNFYYDLVFIPGDRVEQFALSSAAFLNNIKIVHLGAGITNSIATYDDILRHQITLQSTIQLCEDQNSFENVQIWFNNFHLRERCNPYVVGNPYLDEIDIIDDSLVPFKDPYDLILINAETLIERDFDYIDIVPNNFIIFIESNPDRKINYRKLLFRKGLQNLVDVINYSSKTYPSLERPRFLGLLKYCSRFISNSSSAYYEAPIFLKEKQIIRIGERNKNRSTPKKWNQDYSTSERIVEILKRYYQNTILKEEVK